MSTDHTIEIWQYGDAPESKPGAKAALHPLRRSLRVTKVDARVVTTRLKEAIAEFQALADEPSQGDAPFEIDTIELSFGVNGSGSIALIGKLEAGMEAAIKVTLKRKRRKSHASR
jgi:hypothetical protein